MLIPKDSTIFFPGYTLHAQVEDAGTYNPDRYLNHPKLAVDYANGSDYMNRDHYAYGGGRRICPGIHLAERTQWRVVAKLLWAFDIQPGLDGNGRELELDMDAYVKGFLTAPLPYKVRFTPRSNKRKEIVEQDYKNIEGFLKEWE